MHHSHGGCPIRAFFARACPELAEGVGSDAAGATLVRSSPPIVYAVVVPVLRKVREGRGTRSCGGFCGLKAGPPARKKSRTDSVRLFTYLKYGTKYGKYGDRRDVSQVFDESKLANVPSVLGLYVPFAQTARDKGGLPGVLSFTSWAATPAAQDLRGGSTQRAGRSVHRCVR